MSCDAQTQTVNDVAAAMTPRVELVDNWHVHWGNVLALVDRLGTRAALHIDPDGWLSARQNLLVAFVGTDAIGHLCFRVQPVVDDDRVVLTPDGKAAVEAYVECFGVDEAHAAGGIASLLIDRARARAVELHCAGFHMDAAPAWG